jgi:hypothetical protein
MMMAKKKSTDESCARLKKCDGAECGLLQTSSTEKYLIPPDDGAHFSYFYHDTSEAKNWRNLKVFRNPTLGGCKKKIIN